MVTTANHRVEQNSNGTGTQDSGKYENGSSRKRRRVVVSETLRSVNRLHWKPCIDGSWIPSKPRSTESMSNLE